MEQCQKWDELLGPKIFPVSSRAVPGGIHSAASSMGFLFSVAPAAALLCSLAVPGWKHSFILESSRNYQDRSPKGGKTGRGGKRTPDSIKATAAPGATPRAVNPHTEPSLLEASLVVGQALRCRTWQSLVHSPTVGGRSVVLAMAGHPWDLWDCRSSVTTFMDFKLRGKR